MTTCRSNPESKAHTCRICGHPRALKEGGMCYRCWAVFREADRFTPGEIRLAMGRAGIPVRRSAR